MGLADRTNSLWQVFSADSPSGARLRRRVAAIGAMVVFLLALLAAVGFIRIALIVVAVAGVGAVLALLLLVLGGSKDRLGESGSAALRRTRSIGASFAGATARGTSRLARSGSNAVVVTRQSATARLPELRNGYSRAQSAAGRHVAAATSQTHHGFGRLQAAAGRQLAAARTQAQSHVRAATAVVQAREPWATPMPAARDKEALRANASGAQLRRDGAYAEAAEQHRAALAIFRELGDRRSEALTLNNLALALDRAGDPGALDLFEESAGILADLGEKQQEGEVIANLALAFRRRGSEERSAEVLELALEKLNPESQAYRKVEELRRAS